MLLSARSARCAALMGEPDELYPGGELEGLLRMKEKKSMRIMFCVFSVTEKIIYPRNTRTLAKTVVIGGKPIDEETCMVICRPKY